MSQNDFLNVVPLFILTSAAILILFSIAVKRNHKVIYVITALSFLGDLFYVVNFTAITPSTIEPLFIFDGFGVFNVGLILAIALVVTMMSYAYFEQREERKEEYYILLILATLGAIVLVISNHFVSMFLGLEILSVSLYSMIAYLRERERSDEAGLKYLILAAFSSAFLLFGMALVYATTGAMDFAGIGEYLTANPKMPLIFATGISMMIVGIGFKLGIVPFHMWTADVYEGAPAPVTAFIATVSKGGMVALLIRFFSTINGHHEFLILIFTILAIASMFTGNLLALQQKSVKRLLAYSSISHMGYLLVAFLAGGSLAVEAVMFYLVAYFITTTGAFGIVAGLSDRDRDAELIDDYKGLFWKRPWTAAIFTTMLLSLAGIPLTAGFVGKFYIIAAGVSTGQWLLVVMLVLNSAVGLYYYIKVIAVMFEQQHEGEKVVTEDLHPYFYIVSGITMALLTASLLWIGIYPNGLVTLIRTMLAGV
ncbi:MAG TPA: NADH-quinone oxidoreductase subunit N [Chryseosolibacter sp.]|nr:NADH-quinone oxidoreductase subunit N [Chryseosolibacter sp.]